MDMHLVAVGYDKAGRITSLRILDADSGEVKDYSYADIKAAMFNKGVSISGIACDTSSNKIIGSNGSFDRYTKVVSGRIVKEAVVILYTIDDIGYRVSNGLGKTCYALTEDVVRAASRVGIANGKVVEHNGKRYISAIRGSYRNIEVCKTPLYKPVKINKEPEINKKKAEIYANSQSDNKLGVKNIGQRFVEVKKQKPMDEAELQKLREMKLSKLSKHSAVNANEKLIDEESGMTVEQKITYSINAIKQIKPFCYSLITCLEISYDFERELSGASRQFDIMKCPFAVTMGKIIINSEIVKDIPIKHIIFMLLHETYHVVMKHTIRMDGRDISFWNIACDLYINSVLINELGLKKPEYENVITLSHGKRVVVAFPGGIYSENVDLSKDTPETLYDTIYENNQSEQQNTGNSGNSGYSENKDSVGSSSDSKNENSYDSRDSSDSGDKNSSDSGGSSDSGDGNSSNSRDSSDSGDKNSSDSRDSSGSGDGDSSDSGDENSSGSGGSSDSGDGDSSGSDCSDKNKSYNKESSRNESSCNEDSSNKHKSDNKKDGYNGNKTDYNSESKDKEKKDKVKFRGDEYDTSDAQDLKSSKDEESMSSSTREQMANSLMKRAASIHKKATGSFGGHSSDYMERYVEKAIAPKINWRNYLRNKLNLKNQKINTFASPDKRFRSRDMIMPGPKAIENNEIDGLKIAIDTSGSITDAEIGEVFSHINNILKKFKANAELLYWDTEVRAVYDFKNIKELLKCRPMGGGGTDPNCIFKYFEECKDYKRGKKVKPSIILVFTDGYFGELDEKYAKKYRDTLWIVKGNNTLEPKFGKKADFKTE